MAKKAKKKQPATEAQASASPVKEDAEAGSPPRR